MNKKYTAVAIIIIVIIGFFAFSGNQKTITVEAPIIEIPTPEVKDLSDMIVVTAPMVGATTTVANPIEITGKARGFWFFEASFPAKIVDANDAELAAFSIETTDEWMTTDFVNFSVIVPFATSTTATGKLILQKSNPSDLPENAEELVIPITF
jgi:hypothetical protein